jgi:putative transposase
MIGQQLMKLLTAVLAALDALLFVKPSGGVLDSQTVKAPHAKARRYDANKKIVGRKRHIVVDTDGRLLMVNLTTPDISDSAGAQAILDAVRKRWPWLKHLFADGAYERTKLLDKAVFRDFVLKIVRRTDKDSGSRPGLP